MWGGRYGKLPSTVVDVNFEVSEGGSNLLDSNTEKCLIWVNFWISEFRLSSSHLFCQSGNKRVPFLIDSLYMDLVFT